MKRPTAIVVSAETLQLAREELLLIGTAVEAADRERIGVLVFRNVDGIIVAAGATEDVPAGEIREIELAGRHRAPVATDRRAAS